MAAQDEDTMETVMVSTMASGQNEDAMTSVLGENTVRTAISASAATKSHIYSQNTLVNSEAHFGDNININLYLTSAEPTTIDPRTLRGIKALRQGSTGNIPDQDYAASGSGHGTSPPSASPFEELSEAEKAEKSSEINTSSQLVKPNWSDHDQLIVKFSIAILAMLEVHRLTSQDAWTLLKRISQSRLSPYCGTIFVLCIAVGSLYGLSCRDYFIFEDAFKQERKVPLTYLEHFFIFEGFLKQHYLNTDGQDFVNSGSYNLMLGSRRGAVIALEKLCSKRQMKRNMRMVMSVWLQVSGLQCLACDSGVLLANNQNEYHCPACKRFYRDANAVRNHLDYQSTKAREELHLEEISEQEIIGPIPEPSTLTTIFPTSRLLFNIGKLQNVDLHLLPGIASTETVLVRCIDSSHPTRLDDFFFERFGTVRDRVVHKSPIIGNSLTIFQVTYVDSADGGRRPAAVAVDELKATLSNLTYGSTLEILASEYKGVPMKHPWVVELLNPPKEISPRAYDPPEQNITSNQQTTDILETNAKNAMHKPYVVSRSRPLRAKFPSSQLSPTDTLSNTPMSARQQDVVAKSNNKRAAAQGNAKSSTAVNAQLGAGTHQTKAAPLVAYSSEDEESSATSSDDEQASALDAHYGRSVPSARTTAASQSGSETRDVPRVRNTGGSTTTGAEDSRLTLRLDSTPTDDRVDSLQPETPILSALPRRTNVTQPSGRLRYRNNLDGYHTVEDSSRRTSGDPSPISSYRPRTSGPGPQLMEPSARIDNDSPVEPMYRTQNRDRERTVPRTLGRTDRNVIESSDELNTARSSNPVESPPRIRRQRFSMDGKEISLESVIENFEMRGMTRPEISNKLAGAGVSSSEIAEVMMIPRGVPGTRTRERLSDRSSDSNRHYSHTSRPSAESEARFRQERQDPARESHLEAGYHKRSRDGYPNDSRNLNSKTYEAREATGRTNSTTKRTRG